MSTVVDCNESLLQMSMPKTFMAPALCVEDFESEAPAAEEMLDHVICSREQLSVQMCLESGDGSGTLRNRRQRVPDSWYHDAKCL